MCPRICLVRDSLRGNKANVNGACTFQRHRSSINIFTLPDPFFHLSCPASPLECQGCSSRRAAPSLDASGRQTEFKPKGG